MVLHGKRAGQVDRSLGAAAALEWQRVVSVSADLEQGSFPCYSKDMAKVTTKLQVTLPKALADAYAIVPGDEITWEAAGPVIRVIPGRPRETVLDRAGRLRHFDEASARLRRRYGAAARKPRGGRGWTREELYERGRPR
jgi:bifunctional DNA-binding transcriptional regulator/antitoxin component of YhaV-PrlF toxin-antitoxin module